MKIINNLQSNRINNIVSGLAKNATDLDTDDYTPYVDLKDYISRHNAQKIPKKKVVEVLP